MVPVVMALLLAGADGLMLSSVAVVLAVRGLLPVWAVAVLVARDLLALVGSLLVGSKIRVNRVGKSATALLMGAIALVVLMPGTAVGEAVFFAGFGLSLAGGGVLRLKNEGDHQGGGAGHPPQATDEQPAEAHDPDSQPTVYGAHREPART